MEKMFEPIWQQIDEGLRDLMAENDTLSDDDLKVKSLRLKCLSDFAETLRKRVNERIKDVNVGPILPLFSAYFEAKAKSI